MNLQPATNQVPAHAVALKAAASAAGSHATATNHDAPDTIDFATLLAHTLPAETGLPIQGDATAAAKEDKTAPPDRGSADPAVSGDPATCQAALQAAAPAIAAGPTIPARSGIAAASTAPAQLDIAAAPALPGVAAALMAPALSAIGAAEQLHGALSATNVAAPRLAAASVAARPTPEPSASAAAQPNAPQLQAETLSTATHFAATPSAAGASANIQMQGMTNEVDNAAAQPDRGLQVLVAPAPANPASPAPLHLEIATPLAAPGWDQQLGQRVMWMSNQHSQIAELRINPPDLGPVELRLTLDQGGQQASLHFSSPHAEVRQTIENAMPRLREMMADAGIALGNATVSGESLPRQAAPDHSRSTPQVIAEAPQHHSDPGELPRTSTHSGNGLVDTFA